MKRKISFILVFVIVFGFTNYTFSQIDFKYLSENADLIVEAKVINQQPFVHDDGYIYTKNTLEVYKSFTDGIDIENFDIITLGGENSGLLHSWSHSVSIAMNESAVFFLRRSTMFHDTYIPFNILKV